MTTLKLIMAVILLSTFKGGAQQLKDYQWKNRILLFFEVSWESDAINSQLEKFSGVREEMVDRHLVLFVVTPKGIFTEHGHPQDMHLKDVYNTVNVSEKFKGAVLIGKDGGVKLKKDLEITPQLVFDLIDSMPMRRAEMQSGKNH
ncbi:DUF4174 domain-containing protein [Ulvibacterium marinum]|uniref:DUF4174 domain-containing protein n=1 Tax=Ulvibacterium marinum TaxID=2419782 RepID=A0A3B0BZN2_9FLAO|nr:DUF4174 domain-containing protein [Ulvibacterium marinum]RKN78390.1 DUF4174 domain-containing protein [Ulvibacterium marinum]